MNGAPLVAKLVTVLAMTVTGAGVGWAVADRAEPVGPSAAIGAWVDWPLDGEVVEGGAIGVLAHAADVNGVSHVELLVGDAKVASADTGGRKLARVDLDWTPPGPGPYELRVAGYAGGSRRSISASVHIEVIAPTDGRPTTTSTTVAGETTTTDTTAPGETTISEVTSTTATTGGSTTTSTTTTRPTTTTSTTVPPCVLVAPVPTGSTVSALRTAQLDWGYRGTCAPDTYRVEVSRTFPRVLYTGTTTDPTRTWTTPTLACGTWYWRVQAIRGRTIGPWSATASFVVSARVC